MYNKIIALEDFVEIARVSKYLVEPTLSDEISSYSSPHSISRLKCKRLYNFSPYSAGKVVVSKGIKKVSVSIFSSISEIVAS